MGKINWGRVFLGGLLAGAVALMLGGVSWYLFFKEELPIMLSHVAGRTFEQTPRSWATWAVIHLGIGFVVIWLYAAIRPRYGPGPKTAAMAGLGAWLVWALADSWWVSINLGTIGAVVIGSIFYLVIFVVAAVVGAWPYKE